MTALTRQHLDIAECGTVGCRHDNCVLHFHGRCHPHAPVSAYYEKQTGEIVICCYRCGELIARVAVAGDPR